MTTLDTGATCVLDMFVAPPVSRDPNYAWEVFNAQTGATIARGKAATNEAAELAAARAISARTLYVTRSEGCWTLRHPHVGQVPLPFSAAALADTVLRHVRALPMAANYQVSL